MNHLVLAVTQAAPTYLAQAMSDPATQKLIDDLSQKDFKWWFSAVFALLIGSGSYILKLQQNQLTEQRKENTLLTDKLITYIKDDHSKGMVLMQDVANTLRQVTAELMKMDDRKH